jgi:hypothetical protein
MNDQNRDDLLEGRDEPEVVPAISSEQPPIAAGIGVTVDNDQDSHVSPSDNDGETVPQDQVVDQVGG